MDRKIFNLFYLGYPDIQEWLKETDIVMVPLGSCEQHGLHLPVCVDSIAAELPVQEAAQRANVPHTPLVWFGYSPQHLREPGKGSGTITLRELTYQSLLYDIGRSLIHQGFSKIVYVTGHTSNLKAVDAALRSIRYETGALPCVFRADAEGIPPIVKDITENPEEETPGWHGSEIETSEMLNFQPELVHLERTGKDFTHAPKWLTEKFTKKNGSPYVALKGWDCAYIPMDHPEYSDTGLIGNPFRASAEKGKKIVTRIADYLVDFLGELKKIKVEVRNRDYSTRA